MGIKSLRAICPSCGGKIHTQPKGLGAVTWMASGPLLVETGTECQHCGVKLTGKVTMQNYAVLADQPKSPVLETAQEYAARTGAESREEYLARHPELVASKKKRRRRGQA